MGFMSRHEDIVSALLTAEKYTLPLSLSLFTFLSASLFFGTDPGAAAPTHLRAPERSERHEVSLFFFSTHSFPAQVKPPDISPRSHLRAIGGA